jgi:hypothetical protein
LAIEPIKLGDIAFAINPVKRILLDPWLLRFDRTNGNTESEHP